MKHRSITNKITQVIADTPVILLIGGRQTGKSTALPALYHFRSQTGTEIDVVLETGAGQLVGIEVKASSSVNQSAFKGLQLLATERPAQFHRGIVLYQGTEAVHFSNSMSALPIRSLWEF